MLESILKTQKRLFGAQLYLIFSVVTEDGIKVQFTLVAADYTLQAGLANPLDQDQDENKKSSFEIEPISWNKTAQKGKTMDNIKGYEVYTSSQKQIQFFYSTFWYVPCKKKKEATNLFLFYHWWSLSWNTALWQRCCQTGQCLEKNKKNARWQKNLHTATACGFDPHKTGCRYDR